MKLKYTNRYYLPGTRDQWIHLATIIHNTREFICFADCFTSQIYIEETTMGNLMYIEDDSLVEEIANFLREVGILDVAKPFLPDTNWLRAGKIK